MSLSPAVVAWQQKWAREVTQVQPNVTVAGQKRVLANNHLDNARQFLLAKRYDLALTNAEHALVSGADTVLRLHGFEVTGTIRESSVAVCASSASIRAADVTY